METILGIIIYIVMGFVPLIFILWLLEFIGVFDFLDDIERKIRN